MLKTIALFGVAGSAIFCLYFWLIYAIWGNPFLVNPKSVDFFIYLIAVAGSIAYYRYLVVAGGTRFLPNFGVGMGTTLMMVVVSILFVYAFTSNIAPNSLKAHIKEQVGYFETNKKAMITHLKEQLENAKQSTPQITAEKMYNSQILTLQKLTAWDMAIYEIGKLLVGLMISLVTALLLRK